MFQYCWINRSKRARMLSDAHRQVSHSAGKVVGKVKRHLHSGRWRRSPRQRMLRTFKGYCVPHACGLWLCLSILVKAKVTLGSGRQQRSRTTLVCRRDDSVMLKWRLGGQNHKHRRLVHKVSEFQRMVAFQIRQDSEVTTSIRTDQQGLTSTAKSFSAYRTDEPIGVKSSYLLRYNSTISATVSVCLLWTFDWSQHSNNTPPQTKRSEMVERHAFTFGAIAWRCFHHESRSPSGRNIGPSNVCINFFTRVSPTRASSWTSSNTPTQPQAFYKKFPGRIERPMVIRNGLEKKQLQAF